MSAMTATRARHPASWPPGGRCEAGSASAELVILTPFLILVTILFVVAGVLANDLQETGDVARASVESAVIASTPAAAEAQAAAAATYEVANDGLECNPYSVTTDVAGFAPGGAVSVQIRCDAVLPALGPLVLPRSVMLSGQASGAIEPYREMG